MIKCSVNGFFNGAACGYIKVATDSECGLPDGNKCVYQQIVVNSKLQVAAQSVVPAPIKVERKVLEKHVEAHLIRKMKKIGGECYKWSSANMRGVPDRICIFPPCDACLHGRIVFVELKKDTKAKLSPGQKKFFARMAQLQVTDCIVIHGKEEVDGWLKSLGYDV